MTQTSNRLFDEFARLMTDAAGVAQGVRREAETAFRTQAERWIADLDLVKREEFDVAKEMIAAARTENERLNARIAELEARLAESGAGGGLAQKSTRAGIRRPASRTKPKAARTRAAGAKAKRSSRPTPAES